MVLSLEYEAESGNKHIGAFVSSLTAESPCALIIYRLNAEIQPTHRSCRELLEVGVSSVYPTTIQSVLQALLRAA